MQRWAVSHSKTLWQTSSRHNPRSFAPEWQRSALEAEQQAAHTLQQSESFYSTHAHNLAGIQISSSVVFQNPQTKLWETYGMVVDIGPHHRYYIKTRFGRVLAHNCHFLRHCAPASLYSSGTAVQVHNTTTLQELATLQYGVTPYNTVSPAPAHQDSSSQLQRSEHPHISTNTIRLIKDSLWP